METANETQGEANGEPVKSSGSNGEQKSEDKSYRAGWGRALEKELPKRLDAQRKELLGELGIESAEDLVTFKSWRERNERERPETEKREKQWQAKEADYAKKLKEYEQKYKEQAEQNLALLIHSDAKEIALQYGAWHADDVYSYINSHLEDTEDSSLVFKDGDLRVDMGEQEAKKKIAEHLQKIRPNYFKSTVPSGGGTGQAATPKLSPIGLGNLDELAGAMTARAMSKLRGR